MTMTRDTEHATVGFEWTIVGSISGPRLLTAARAASPTTGNFIGNMFFGSDGYVGRSARVQVYRGDGRELTERMDMPSRASGTRRRARQLHRGVKSRMRPIAWRPRGPLSASLCHGEHQLPDGPQSHLIRLRDVRE
jgi:hypothetical protein